MPETTLSRPIPVVRLIVLDSLRRVLILKRAIGGMGGGCWCLPGGKIDYGETAEQAASRELEEEIGLTPTALRFVCYQDSLPIAPGKMHCINLYFECTAERKPILNGESTESAWIGPADLKNYEIAFRNNLGLERYWEETSSVPPGKENNTRS